MHITWSPFANVFAIHDVAAVPEENARPCFPPSQALICLSKAPRVGFPDRWYSYPRPKEF